MSYQKTLSAALAAALLLAGCSHENAQQNAASAQTGAAQEYIVATDAAYAPLEYMEGEQVVGFSRDILAAAGEKEGIKFNFVNTPFEGIFANVQKGDSDVALASITITDERKQIVDFTDPYFEATQMIVTADKGSDIKSFADLKTRSVSVQNGTTADLILQDLQGKDSKLIRRFANMPLRPEKRPHRRFARKNQQRPRRHQGRRHLRQNRTEMVRQRRCTAGSVRRQIKPPYERGRLNTFRRPFA